MFATKIICDNRIVGASHFTPVDDTSSVNWEMSVNYAASLSLGYV